MLELPAQRRNHRSTLIDRFGSFRPWGSNVLPVEWVSSFSFAPPPSLPPIRASRDSQKRPVDASIDIETENAILYPPL